MKKLTDNALEIYIYLLITIGLPLSAALYFDLKAALLVFVVTQIAIGVFALRNNA